ncbi:MAG: hypothetical protein ACERKZ_08745 [Lachnotalea sp.]
MNKKIYFISCIIFIVLFATNITNDKYYMNYQNSELTVNNESDISGSKIIIYGDNTNEGNFITTPKVDLPKGEYKISIKYETDTEFNYVKVKGKNLSKEIEIPEEEKYLNMAIQEKVIHITLEEDVHDFNVKLYFCGQGTLVFQNMTVESENIANTDTIAWILIFLTIFITIGLLAYYKPTQENRKKMLVIFSLVAITIIASYPMFNNYIIKGDDIAFHLTRIDGIKSGLLSGQFPVRVHTSTLYHYGYAVSIFYPELFLYIPALLRIAGVSLTGTVQIFIILINFATASIMYFSAYKISKVRSIGILSSILYVLASYHLCDIYNRFAIGEVLAMAFLPLVIYGVYELLCNDYTKWKIAVVGATGLLQSHIILTAVTIALVGVVVIICIKNLRDKNRLIACVKASAMVVLLNLWFIVPLVSMMKQDMSVTSLGRDVENLSLYVTQLFQNFIINGKSRNIIGTDLEGVMSLNIGFSIILGIMLFVYVVINNRMKNKKELNLITSLLGLGLLCAFATMNLFPWKIIVEIPLLGKMARMIQFPWRLLAFAVAFLSIVAAYGIFYFVKKEETRRIIIVITFAISALFASHYLDNFMERDIYCYKGADKVNTGIGTGEYYYKGTDSDSLIKRGESIVASSDTVIINQYERRKGTLSIELKNNSNEEQYIEIPLAYYPFYKAKLNNTSYLKIAKGDNNIVRIIVPSNTVGNIKVKYVEPNLWRLTDVVSAFIIILFLFSFSKRACLKFKDISDKVFVTLRG